MGIERIADESGPPGDDDELPIGQGLYEDLVDAVAELPAAQMLELVNAVQARRPWEKLPVWAKNLFIALEAGDSPV